MTETNEQMTRALCQDAFGLVFFFFDDPAASRSGLVAVLEDIWEAFQEPFTRISTDGETHHSLRGEGLACIVDRIRSEGFGASVFVRLTNATNQRVQTQKVEFYGRRLEAAYALKTPNYLYLELPAGWATEAYWNLFRKAFLAKSFHLGYGHPIVARNDELLPRSGAAAATAIRRSTVRARGFYESWGNPSYLAALARDGAALEGPTQLLALGPTFSDRVTFEQALTIARRNRPGVTFEPGDGWSMFRAYGDEEERQMAEFVRPLFAVVERPLMFWKDSEWHDWRRRVCLESP